MSRFRQVAAALCAGCAAVLSFSSPALGAVLLSESFEGLTLKPYTSPTESGGDGTDWTEVLPAGWVSSFGASPVGNPIEFQGWRAHDVDSWIATEGNQDRNLWTLGGVGSRGTVLLVDPDAYDDGTNIDDALFNATVTTPPISLAGLTPGSVSIAFDSFFRNEESSDLLLDVSYDGGATYSTNLVTYESSSLPDGDVFQERLNFPVANPGAGSLVFKFTLREGSNDWWWAIDDVEISGTQIPEPSTVALGGLAIAALAGVRRKRAA
jgi:hypothetical protein